MRAPDIANEVLAELARANAKFPPFSSSHEGYAVILEELDELWDNIKTNALWTNQRKEAIQVAAMVIKYVKYIDKRIEGVVFPLAYVAGETLGEDHLD